MIPHVIPNSSHDRWPRGLQYTVSKVKDPAYPEMHYERLVPMSGSRAKWYEPTEDHELPDRLIEVATGLTSPVEFANEYGLLGYSQLHRWEGIPTPEMGDAPLSLLMAEDPEFTKQLANPRAPAHIELAMGEPLYWFKAHARTVNAARDLLICLKSKNEGGLRDLLEALPHMQYAALGGLSGEGAFGWVTDYAARDLMGAVQEALIGLINPNIQGLQRELHIDSFGQLRYSLTFTALIQVIYWHLVAHLDDKLPPRYCLRCGEPFFPADPRQRYCPKPLGKSRSVCGARAVKEAFKERWPRGKSEHSSQEKHRQIRKPPKGRKRR
jgi:hypothetical protein